MQFLIAIVSGFAGGVFMRSLFFTGSTLLTTGSLAPILFVVLLVTLVGAFAFFKLRHTYTLATIFFICVALGMGRAAISDTPLPESFAADIRHRVSYEGIVISDPDVRDANQRIQIQVMRGGESTNVLAVTSRNTDAAVGDKVNVSGTLLVPEPFADDNGRIFRYDKYLQKDGVRFIMNYAYIRVESHAPRYSLSAALAKVKHAFINGIKAVLPEPHASLSSGIVIGGKSGLGNEIKESFIRSGLIHVVVLSGHNVMVVASWVIAFFVFLSAKIETVSGKRIPRSVSICFGVLVLILFVGIAGASATAVRAALMALIALYALATGRTYAAGRALLFVILLMLVWNPLYLVFDPGFGLSVAATAGLIWLAPIIERMMDFVSPSSDEGLTKSRYGFWKNVIATTLAAQISVLPLLLYNTGNLSIVAIPANLFAVPFIPFAMGFSFLAGFAGMIFSLFAPIIGIVIAFPAYLANEYLLFIASESSSLPLAAVILPPFPFWLTFVAYAGLIYWAWSPACADRKRFSTTDQFKFVKKASI